MEVSLSYTEVCVCVCMNEGAIREVFLEEGDEKFK